MMSWEDGNYWEQEYGDVSSQVPHIYNPSYHNPDVRAISTPDSDDGVVLILIIGILLIVCGCIIGYAVTHDKQSENEAVPDTLSYGIYEELEAKGGTVVLGSSVSCEVLKEDTLTITSDNYICVHKTGYDTAKGVWKPYNVYIPIDQILYISIKLAS
jgi:hypothetical protein